MANLLRLRLLFLAPFSALAQTNQSIMQCVHSLVYVLSWSGLRRDLGSAALSVGKLGETPHGVPLFTLSWEAGLSLAYIDLFMHILMFYQFMMFAV